jgi:hypothetical protein
MNTHLLQNLDQLETRCIALADDATPKQCEALLEWIMESFGSAALPQVAETVLFIGPSDVYASLRERIGEFGL